MDVPGGNVSGNGFVWRRFAFAPIVTDRIRVLVSSGGNPPDYARIVEVEAWSVSAPKTVTGTLSAGAGGALAGVTMAGTNGALCTASDASGHYGCTVPLGWTGTVTPLLTGNAFLPGSRSYSALPADQAGQDYVGGPSTLSIAGTATLNGSPLAGVAFSGDGATCSSSDASGAYSCSVPFGYSGTITAALLGDVFAPATRTYASITASQSAQDYTGQAAAPAGTVYYIQTDHLNTPRAIADQSANTVWRWDQDESFGNSVPNADPGNTGVAFDFPLRFPGQYFDRETSLAYNSRRDYDPSIGRYAESDPMGLGSGINTYVCALNGPLMFSDPSGLCITITLPIDFSSHSEDIWGGFDRWKVGAVGTAGGEHGATPWWVVTCICRRIEMGERVRTIRIKWRELTVCCSGTSKRDYWGEPKTFKSPLSHFDQKVFQWFTINELFADGECEEKCNSLNGPPGLSPR